MSPLHLPGLRLSVWQEDRMKDGPVNRQLHCMTDELWGWLDGQTGRRECSLFQVSGREPGRHPEPAQYTASDSLSFCAEREGETERGRKGRKKSSNPVFVASWRISLSLHPPQWVLWQVYILKQQAGREGAVTRKRTQVGERRGGRQRNRGREQVSEILPFICLSFTPLCSPDVWRGDWFSDAGIPLLIRPTAILSRASGGNRKRQYKRKGVAPFWLSNFSPLLFLISQDRLSDFCFFGFFFE